MAIYITWWIWKSRCSFLFNSKHMDPAQILAAAHNDAQFVYSLRSPSDAPQGIHWLPPPPGSLKINVDAALDGQAGAISMIVRNNLGEVIDFKAQLSVFLDPLILEAKALLLACEWAPSYSKQIIIHSDNLTLVQAVLNNTTVPYKVQDWVFKCRSEILIKKLLLEFSPRVTNYVADSLAKWVLRSPSSSVSGVLPLHVMELICKDIPS